VLAFRFSSAEPQIERILAIGCHADDLEIGCGGTMLALTRAYPEVHVTWVVLAARGERAVEATASAARFLSSAAVSDVRVLDFRDGFLPHEGTPVKEQFEALKAVEPDLVFTHSRNDLHQDHRFACELTWNTFREHLILEYEIPKYDGDFGQPNVFVPLDEHVVNRKVQLVLEGFPSQRNKHWFDADVMRGAMRLRGMECAQRYAEAFSCRKLRMLA
jgi:LmbE family N-acetylglucosaminyl deacetylase